MADENKGQNGGGNGSTPAVKTADKVPAKVSKYEGIMLPPPPVDLGELHSLTIEGGAFFKFLPGRSDPILIDAEGRELDDAKLAKFREHHETLAKARAAP